MMKSFFKKLAFIMALAMVVSLAAPAAQTASAAETKEFTYAYQEGGKVTKLYMKAGDTVDLKFVGVKDYADYELEWNSVFTNVATVDNKGVITAQENGKTFVYLNVKDSNYTSDLVEVIVGEDAPAVVLGTSKDNTFAEATLTVGGAAMDLNFYGVVNYNATNYTTTWISNAPEVAKVDQKGIVVPVAAGSATVTIAIVNNVTGDTLNVTPVVVTVVAPTPTPEPTEVPATATPVPTEVPATATPVPTEVPATATPVPTATATPVPTATPTATPAPTAIPLEAKQKTHAAVVVTFADDHSFDITGEEGNNTVKLYRMFKPEDAEKMGSNAFDFMDEAGNGYQAYYIMKVEGSGKVWTITGYNAFKDGADYAVVYGPNKTSSTLNGVMDVFTASVGKVAKIVLSATDATVENEIEPAIPAVLSTKLYDKNDIDLTAYYGNADETEYELVEEDLDVSVSGNEVTFDEAGVVTIMGSYTFYDEDLEEDVVIPGYVDVKGSPYTTYEVAMRAWTLVAEGAKPDWSKINHSMIAGDAGQLYVVVEDNRGNYYTNYEGSTKYNNKAVYYVGDSNQAFEQYGYELVFDSLDPDSLLVDAFGAVESYKETKSFAVVSYRRSDVDNAKTIECGIMGVTVTAPRKLTSVSYNKTSFTILKETEWEDGEKNFYANKADFSLSDTLKVTMMTQYKNVQWGQDAEDWGEVEPFFTVTTSKDDFKGVAEYIADCLNADGAVRTFPINFGTVFAGTDATSVTFKIKESVTGDSTTITIKLNEPKYVTDANGQETELVYVDPSRAILEAGNVELYDYEVSTAKLFQVSKASQKIGFFRVGTLENNDEKTLIDGVEVPRSYYVANELTAGFVTKNGELTFVSTASGSSLETASVLNRNDYVLVVTDPQGRIFPAQGNGGNGKAFGADSNLGVRVNNDGTAYELVFAAYDAEGKIEYAATGTYRVTVYKITSNVPSGAETKYNVSRVVSDSFTVTKDFRPVTFYHQTTTKDATNVDTFEYCEGELDATILQAISDTMTFQIAGQKFAVKADGTQTYKCYLNKHSEPLPIRITSVDYRVQNDGQRAVINTVTFEVTTDAGFTYTSKVVVNRSINVSAE